MWFVEKLHSSSYVSITLRHVACDYSLKYYLPEQLLIKTLLLLIKKIEKLKVES